ncbi:aminoglycoside phosphotransferase family protein [Kribbella sp. NBC_00382]|uniref:aminoglycoside phosphotransferase family protein n=1 Tax=Kribbella sp. NBC_00382 TaxID=2975967 RepID=UPI002E239DBF
MLDPTRFASIEPVQGFVGNESFRLRTDAGETLYYKSGAAAAMSAEVWACERARQAGVLAPEIVESGPGYLIERALKGSASAEPAVLEQAGGQLRRLHEVAGEGYGFLQEGLRDDWLSVLVRPLDNLEVLAGIVDDELVRRLRGLRFADRLTPVAPRLLHGDLHPRHVFAEGNQFTGFIDWGDVAFGDPLFDLGRFSRAGEAATDALLRGYGIERSAELDWTLAFYRTIWGVMAMLWEHAAGGDWYAAHLEAIAADLPVLEN